MINVALIVQLHLLRLINQFTSQNFRSKKKDGEQKRLATAGKPKSSIVFSVVLTLLFLIALGFFADQAIKVFACEAIAKKTGIEQAFARCTQQEDVTHYLHSRSFEPLVIHGLSLLLFAAVLIGFVIPMSSRTLTNLDWDLEWLVTLPIKRQHLVLSQVIARLLGNVAGFFALYPLLVMIAWYANFQWYSPLVALIIAIPLLGIASAVWVLGEIGLRLTLSATNLRNFQGFVTLLNMPLTFFYASLGTGNWCAIRLAKSIEMPWHWIAPGHAVLALNSSYWSVGLVWLGLLYLQSFLVVSLLVLMTNWLIRGGLVVASSRASARKSFVGKPRNLNATDVNIGLHLDVGKHPLQNASVVRRQSLSMFASAWLSPIQQRELTLLARDRNYLLQCLVLPVLSILGQYFLIGNGADNGAKNQLGFGVIAGFAFGTSVYVLMMSAFQNLNNEGQSIWLLYTFPKKISQVLKEKAVLWALLSAPYAIAIFTFGALQVESFNWSDIGLALYVLIGVALFALIAVALGVFASNPLAQEQHNKIRPTYLYLYMTLTGVYGYGLYAKHWWDSVVLVILTLAMAFSLMQKASDQLPYLLDPVAAPPPRVSLSGGLIAVMMFFVFQILAAAIIGLFWKQISAVILLAFTCSGALTFCVMRFTYWRANTQDIPRFFVRPSDGAGRFFNAVFVQCALAVLLGLVCAVFALGYLQVAPKLFPQANASWQSDVGRWWVAAAVVLAAPLFEEFIFRGLVFAGLRRSMTLPNAMIVSAAIFAVVHPPISMIPVFVVGLATAYAFERTQSLCPAVLVHATYNGVIVGVNF
jgi:ABC-2 type transport system permease protein